MPRHRFVIRLFALMMGLCLFAASSLTLAQSEPQSIQLGQNAIGALTAETTALNYAFAATGGETATVQLLALSPGFAPRLRVTNPEDVEILNLPNPDGETSLESAVAFTDAGTYTIQVEGENGSAGQFVLSLQAGASLPQPTDLVLNQPLTETVGDDTPLRLYRFSTDPASDQPLTLQIETSGAGVLVSVINVTSGKTVASSDADLSAVAFRFPPGERSYRVEVRSGGAPEDAPYTLCLGSCGAGLFSNGAPFSDVIVTTRAAAPATETPNAAPGVLTCRILSNSNGSINIRSAPGTQYSIIGSLPRGQTLPVVGVLAGGAWVQVSLLTGQSGWIAASVSRLEGECSALPLATAPANAPLAPTQPPAPAPTLPPVPTTSSSGSSGGTVPTAVPPTTAPPAAPLPDITPFINEALTRIDPGAIQVYWGTDVGRSPITTSFAVEICIDTICSRTSYAAFGLGARDESFVVSPDALDQTRIAHTIKVTVDVDGEIAESNEGNNVATYNFQLAS